MAFFLIPTFATRPIMYGLGASLVAASVLVPGPFALWRLARGALLAGAGALLFLFAPVETPSPLPGGTVVFEKETAYHHLRVVDAGARRSLFFNNANQGFVDPRPGKEPPPNYTDGMAMALAFRDRPLGEALAIGLGTGLVPSLVARRSPATSMTTIEIDPEVVSVAGRYFGFAPRAKDRVLVGDGRRELTLDSRTYDAIFLDAYFADSVPFHLMTREFDELCKERMASDGILSVNLVGILTGSKNALFWAAVKTLRATFPCVYVFSPELVAGSREFRGNAIVVATRSRDRLDRATIVERTRSLAERLGRPAIATWGAALYDGEMRVADVPLLTDAYAPTDALQHLVKR
jgi:spermidine synthase